MIAALKRYPPHLGHVRVPTRSRRGTQAALSLYAPCRTSAQAAHRLAWAATGVVGHWALPGRRQPWDPPTQAWDALVGRWRDEIGPFDEVAVYQPTQADRVGLCVLAIADGRPTAFIRAHEESASVTREAEALAVIHTHRPTSVWVPEPRATGTVDGVHYLTVTPLPGGLHQRPHSPQLEVVTGDVTAALAGLDRPADIPDHWRPMHGDFTPWNLRELADGRLVLFDWERAGWGPPDADLVLYRAVDAALDGHPPPHTDADEAVDWWLRDLDSRQGQRRDEKLEAGMRRALEQMRSSA